MKRSGRFFSHSLPSGIVSIVYQVPKLAFRVFYVKYREMKKIGYNTTKIIMKEGYQKEYM